MYLTLIGILLGGVISWLITHVYYKVTLKKAAISDPTPHLRALSEGIEELKNQLRDENYIPRNLQLSLDQMGHHVTALSHIFRHSLQGLFADIGHLKLVLQRGDTNAAKRLISEIEPHMQQLQRNVGRSSKDRLTYSEKDKVSSSMSGKRLLIVDDDTAMTARLAACFVERGADDVVTAGSIDEGFKKLTTSLPFDLLILDIMLPETEENRVKIQVSETERLEVLEILEAADENAKSEKESSSQLDQAEKQLRIVTNEIRRLINEDGGLVLLEKWLQNTPHVTNLPPVLFLSAVGNNDVMRRGLELTKGRAEWIVKPISLDGLLEYAARLIAISNRNTNEMSKDRQ